MGNKNSIVFTATDDRQLIRDLKTLYPLLLDGTKLSVENKLIFKLMFKDAKYRQSETTDVHIMLQEGGAMAIYGEKSEEYKTNKLRKEYPSNDSSMLSDARGVQLLSAMELDILVYSHGYKPLKTADALARLKETPWFQDISELILDHVTRITSVTLDIGFKEDKEYPADEQCDRLFDNLAEIGDSLGVTAEKNNLPQIIFMDYKVFSADDYLGCDKNNNRSVVFTEPEGTAREDVRGVKKLFYSKRKQN